MTDDYVTRINL